MFLQKFDDKLETESLTCLRAGICSQLKLHNLQCDACPNTKGNSGNGGHGNGGDGGGSGNSTGGSNSGSNTPAPH